jgi:hypothetical protein
MLRFLALLLSSIFGFLAFAFDTFVQAVGRTFGVAPSVPPADDDGELEEIAKEDIALDAAADLNATRDWASAKLFGRRFEMPAGRIGGWLSQLDITHADRIATADLAGVLDRHLAGREMVPGLPPVNDTAATKRWLARNRPVGRKRVSEVEQTVAPVVDDVVQAEEAHVYEFPRAA